MEDLPSISDYGFREPQGGIASGPGQAASLAREIGFPVVLKVESPDILHKTDIGGIALHLASEEGVRSAYERIVEAAQRHRPDARLPGVRVEQMLSGGVEFIIGLENDPQFGPVLLFGTGGSQGEAAGPQGTASPLGYRGPHMKVLGRRNRATGPSGSPAAAVGYLPAYVDIWE